MGWSELTAKPELDRIFKKLGLKYAMRRVLQPGNPVIQIQHEKEIDIPTIGVILTLFPDFVYIELSANITFQDDNQGDNFEFVDVDDTTKPKAGLSELEKRAEEKYGGDRSGLVVGYEKQ